MMSSKKRHTQEEKNCLPGDLEAVFLQFLKHYYECEDRENAKLLASQLEDMLASSSEYAGTIKEEEIRSVLAQFRGNLSAAIQSREAEIRKILELHALAANTPNWKYVSQRYDFADVSDRLDLLAILYDEQGELDRTIAVLMESKQYCQSHGIPFDAPDLLAELERAGNQRGKSTMPRNGSSAKLDQAIRRAYAKFGAPSDEILVASQLSRQFTRAVNRLLPSPATSRDIKRRLLALRRRGASQGGLPRLRPRPVSE